MENVLTRLSVLTSSLISPFIAHHETCLHRGAQWHEDLHGDSGYCEMGAKHTDPVVAVFEQRFEETFKEVAAAQYSLRPYTYSTATDPRLDPLAKHVCEPQWLWIDIRCAWCATGPHGSWEATEIHISQAVTVKEIETTGSAAAKRIVTCILAYSLYRHYMQKLQSWWC